MKKKIEFLIFCVCLLGLMGGCAGDKRPLVITPQYEYAVDYYVPDSAMPETREWIKETVRATNEHLSAGDYEDVWNTIRVSREEGLKLFSVRTEGLNIRKKKGFLLEFVPYEWLTVNERKIFEELRPK